MRGEHDIQRNRWQRTFGAQLQIEHACRSQHRGDDSHRFLRVVSTVAQRIGGGRQKLAAAECLVHPCRRRPLKNPEDCQHQNESEDKSDHRRRDDKNKGLDPSFGFQQTAKPLESDDGRAGIATHQSVRTGGWQSEIPRHQVPGDRSHQSGAQNIKTEVLADQIDAHQIAADRFSDARAKDCERHEVENGRPDYRRARRKHARGNDGGD